MTIHRSRIHRAARLAPLVVLASITAAACGSDAPAAQAAPVAASAEAATTEAPLNINDASEAELRTIPGVGEEIAHEIVEYRPYESFDTFREEVAKYISEDEIARIETYLTLD